MKHAVKKNYLSWPITIALGILFIATPILGKRTQDLTVENCDSRATKQKEKTIVAPHNAEEEIAASHDLSSLFQKAGTAHLKGTELESCNENETAILIKKIQQWLEGKRKNISSMESFKVLLTKVLPKSQHAIDFFSRKSMGYEHFIDDETIQKLHIIEGTSEHPEANLLEKIMRKKASATERLGVLMHLSTPTKNIDYLKDMQQILSKIKGNSVTYQKFKVAYDQLANLEGTLLPFFSDEKSDETKSDETKSNNLLIRWFFKWSNFIEDPFKYYNIKAPKFIQWIYIESRRRFVTEVQIPIVIFTLIISPPFFVKFQDLGYFYYLLHFVARPKMFLQNLNDDPKRPLKMSLPFNDKKGKLASRKVTIPKAIIKLKKQIEFIKKKPNINACDFIELLNWFFIVIQLSIGIKYVIQSALKYVTKMEEFCSLFNQQKEFLNIVKQIVETTEQDPELRKKLLPQLKHSQRLINLQHPNPEVNANVKKLLTYDFKNKYLFLKSYAPMLFLREWIEENIYLFQEAFIELAQVGAFVAISGNMIESENSLNQWNASIFLEQPTQPTPLFKSKKLWDPFLGAEKAVPNDLDLNENTPTNLLVGANAGGKTTLIRSSLIAAYLSMTFGIVPAQEIVLTLFDRLCFYHGVEGNVGNELSTLVAELESLRSIWQHIIYCNNHNQWMFVGCDEPLKGTNPQEATAITIALYEEFTKKPQNNLLIQFSTHNPGLIKKGFEDPHTKLMQPQIERLPNGFFRYLYQLQEIDEHTKPTEIAIDLFEQYMPSTSTVKRARKLRNQM